MLSRNFTRYADTGDYMPVKDCHCLNMITAVIDYYKRQPKRLKTILLNQTHWRLFIEDMRRIDDSRPVDAEKGVQFEGSDVTIKKGSMLQQLEMQYEFFTDAELIPDTYEKIITAQA